MEKKRLKIMEIRLIVCLMVLFFSGSCLAESEIFKIRNRRAVEVLPVVEALLSPQGKAVADQYGNTIIVNDHSEIIAEVRTLLLSSDQPIPQVRVELAFDAAGSGQALGFGRSTRKSGRHLSTEDSHSRYAKSGSRGSGRSFITVSSGSSGYIRMAREVPITERWLFLCRRHGVPILLKETRTIETGMEVLPVAAGDQVIVTVTPRISWMDNGQIESFRFVEASTTVSMPRSQWFDLGGVQNVLQSDNDIFRTILSTDDTSEKKSFLMRIKADVR